MQAFQIAIDGPSGAGKSTMAKHISKKLGIMYLDTGAMYRAMALKAIRLGLDTKDAGQVAPIADTTHIGITFDNGNQSVWLDGEDITSLIRTNEISKGASDISAHAVIRERLVALQQQIASDHSVVMDGRDIGTHVLPNAQVKIYLTASVEDRARRRFDELKEKGLSDISYEALVKEIETRDYNDSNRRHSPLRKADDAVLVDTSNLSIEQSIELIMSIIQERLTSHAL